MRIAAAFGLLALLPAAVDAAPPSPHRIVATICGDFANGRTIVLPLPAGDPAREPDTHCWSKGCHAAGSRKRLGRHI